MANNVTTDLDPFKRGDTAGFKFHFSNPYVGFDWSAITCDAAITAVQSPTDNTGAVAVRLNQPLIVDDTGAYYLLQLTVAEAKALVVGATYNTECQLKQGSLYVATPATGVVKALQDYII